MNQAVDLDRDSLSSLGDASLGSVCDYHGVPWCDHAQVPITDTNTTSLHS